MKTISGWLAVFSMVLFALDYMIPEEPDLAKMVFTGISSLWLMNVYFHWDEE